MKVVSFFRTLSSNFSGHETILTSKFYQECIHREERNNSMERFLLRKKTEIFIISRRWAEHFWKFARNFFMTVVIAGSYVSRRNFWEPFRKKNWYSWTLTKVSRNFGIIFSQLFFRTEFNTSRRREGGEFFVHQNRFISISGNLTESFSVISRYLLGNFHESASDLPKQLFEVGNFFFRKFKVLRIFRD